MLLLEEVEKMRCRRRERRTLHRIDLLYVGYCLKEDCLSASCCCAVQVKIWIVLENSETAQTLRGMSCFLVVSSGRHGSTGSRGRLVRGMRSLR